MTDEQKKNSGIPTEAYDGIYATDVPKDGGAYAAGIRRGDRIQKVNNVDILSGGELQEQVSRYRPGDKISVDVKRDNKRQQFNVTLRNKLGDTSIITAEDNNFLGAKFETITQQDQTRLRINRGIRITDVGKGKFKDAGVKNGFIITDVNKRPVSSIDDLRQIISNAKGGILIEGVYSNGERAYFVFGAD